MDPIPFKGWNKIYTYKEGYDLNVNEAICEDGTKVVTSCWQLTKPEIEKLRETGRIYLCVLGGQPPVKLSLDKPEHI